MQIITREYKVYKLEELSEEAKEYALSKWNENQDYPFLTDDLREYIREELDELGLKIIGVSTTENPSIRPLYDLSYSQGSGLMFEATLEDKEGNIYTIKQSGHYTHERSTNIEGVNQEGEYIETKDFEENIYIPLCKRVAKKGYEEIEYMESMESFSETCEANDYKFLENGTMFS